MLQRQKGKSALYPLDTSIAEAAASAECSQLQDLLQCFLEVGGSSLSQQRSKKAAAVG
jgi:hypothetical protein